MLARLRCFILGGPVALAAAVFGPAGLRGALAHHGWRWDEDGNFELTGIIETVQLGNPHGVLTVDAEGEVWTGEVGQPWRNEQAGLTDEMLAVGREVTISGARSADHSEKDRKSTRLNSSH